MKPTNTFDKEAVKFNLAKLKRGGQAFEIVVNPDKILDYKEGKVKDVRDIVESEKIFSDAKRGLLASETLLSSIFRTDDNLKIIEQILREGEMQFTQEYREKKRAEKKKRIIDIIVRNAEDPRTHLPHPRMRIEAAFEDARVRIDETMDAESQVKEALERLRPILPIRFATKQVKLSIPTRFVGASMRIVRSYGQVKSEEWHGDGSWSCVVEIPSGVRNDFFDELNKVTHGEVESEIIEDK